MERNESPLSIKEHMHSYIHTHKPIFSFDGTVPDKGPGGARVRSGSVEFSHVKCSGFTVKSTLAFLHSQRHGNLVQPLSEFVLTVQVK